MHLSLHQRLRYFMDWANPVDWFAWIYGKIFQNHVYAGGAMVVIAFALIGLVLWIRGVDKYKEEHPPKGSIAAQQQDEPPINSASLTTTQVPESEKSVHPPEKLPMKKPKSSVRSKSTTTSTVINAPGGIGISGGNVSNPTVNNYGPPPPKPLVMDSVELAKLSQQLEQFRGQRIELKIKNSPDAIQFAGQLEGVMREHGIVVARVNAGMLITSGGAEPVKGISLAFGTERQSDANAFGIAVVQTGIENKPLEAYRSTPSNKLLVYVRSRID
jgi:hypothetical protein